MLNDQLRPSSRIGLPSPRRSPIAARAIGLRCLPGRPGNLGRWNTSRGASRWSPEAAPGWGASSPGSWPPRDATWRCATCRRDHGRDQGAVRRRCPCRHARHHVRRRRGRRIGGAVRSPHRWPTSTRPTTSTCCSTTPASVAAAASCSTSAPTGRRTFNICWGGVYLGTRAFMPMLLASSEGHIVNTSSVNGFWASLGLGIPHTAYSAAKFAVKGFTEALITDFRLNAPHLRASVVMPGHIGTSIVINSGKVLGRDPKELTGRADRRASHAIAARPASTSAARATTTSASACRSGARCSATTRR